MLIIYDFDVKENGVIELYLGEYLVFYYWIRRLIFV